MDYATIESIEEEIKELKEMIKEMIFEEFFFLKKEDLKIIEKGREDYFLGKTICEKELRRYIE